MYKNTIKDQFKVQLYRCRLNNLFRRKLTTVLNQIFIKLILYIKSYNMQRCNPIGLTWIFCRDPIIVNPYWSVTGVVFSTNQSKGLYITCLQASDIWKAKTSDEKIKSQTQCVTTKMNFDFKDIRGFMTNGKQFSVKIFVSLVINFWRKLIRTRKML